MAKKILITLAILIIGIGLGACAAAVVSAADTASLHIWPESENGPYEVLRVTDDETKVEYIVVATEIGNGERSIAITPRLTEHGNNIYTTGSENR